MITKEELQKIMQQDNAVDVVYKMLSEQERRIKSLEDELNRISSDLMKI